MSAAPSLALEKTQRRAYPRRPVHVPLDVIALRSGVPENLPGRCTDLSEGGVGAVIAGELVPDQPVAVELRLPNVGIMSELPEAKGVRGEKSVMASVPPSWVSETLGTVENSNPHHFACDFAVVVHPVGSLAPDFFLADGALRVHHVPGR